MGAVTAYELVTSRLREVTDWEPRGGKGDWRCPAHDDSSASLSVSQGNKGALLYCQAGCTTEAVLEALRLTKSDLFDEPPKQATPKSTIAATYDYTDEQGWVLYQVVRTDPKGFRQRRPDGTGGWDWKLGEVRRVLYRLPNVLQAVAKGETVYVVEGEKDVEAVEAAGAVATCNPGGAGKWRNEYSGVLRGANVIIVADKDLPGYAHARAVAKALKGVAASIVLLEPGFGKDIAEHLATGHALDELVDMVEPAKLGQSEEPVEVLRPFRRHVLDLSKPPAPATMLLRYLYGDGCLTIAQSEPGVGKTWIADWLTMQVIEQGFSVVYIDEEGGPDLMTERLLALGADADMVRERVCYYAFESRKWDDEDLIALDEVIRQASGIGRGLALAVLDSLPDFLAAADWSEDSAMDVTTFVIRVCGRFRVAGCSQFLLDHVPKPQTEGRAKRSRYSRGSGAKLAKADATLLLEVGEEFDTLHSGFLKLWKTKDRRGRLEVPSLTHDPLILEFTVGDGTVAIAAMGGSDARQRFRPTFFMEKVSFALEEASDQTMTKRAIRDAVKGDNNKVDGAIKHLIEEGFVRAVSKGLRLIKPFRRVGETVEPDSEDQAEWEF